MTIVREFTQDRDGVSARVVVSTTENGFQAAYATYGDAGTGRAILSAVKGAQRFVVLYPGWVRAWVPRDEQMERVTHGVPITTEYHMTLVAMRWIGIVA